MKISSFAAGAILVLASAGMAAAATYGSQPATPEHQPHVLAPALQNAPAPHPVARPVPMHAPAAVHHAVVAHHDAERRPTIVKHVIVRHVVEHPVIVRRVIEHPVIVRRVVEHPIIVRRIVRRPVIVRRIVVRRVVRQVICPQPVRHVVTRRAPVPVRQARIVPRMVHRSGDVAYAQSHYDYYSQSRVSEVVEQRGYASESVRINGNDFNGGVGDRDGSFTDGYGQVHFYAGFQNGASANGPTYNSYEQSFQSNGMMDRRSMRPGMNPGAANGAPHPLGPR